MTPKQRVLAKHPGASKVCDTLRASSWHRIIVGGVTIAGGPTASSAWARAAKEVK